MLFTNLMVGADNRTLEQRPCVLDAIGMHVPAHIFFSAVIDSEVLMRSVQRTVGWQFVSKNLGVLVNSILNDPHQGIKQEILLKPGLFYVWRPERIEKILPDTMKGSDEAARLEKRGITPVFVPANDVDRGGDELDSPTLGRGLTAVSECLLKDNNPVHQHSDGTWWFYEEAWADENGPYQTQEKANSECDQYCKDVPRV